MISPIMRGNARWLSRDIPSVPSLSGLAPFFRFTRHLRAGLSRSAPSGLAHLTFCTRGLRHGLHSDAASQQRLASTQSIFNLERQPWHA
jgi:hypothetical protein